MRRFLFLCLSVLLGANTLWSQARTISGNQEQSSSNYYSMRMQNLRISDGKVWVNGNLLQENELPQALKKLDPDYHLQASFVGNMDFSFVYDRQEYVVRKGRIMEIPSPKMTMRGGGAPEVQSKEQYYQAMKEEAPSLFHNLLREAALKEEINILFLDYELARGELRNKIKEEIRGKLSEFFDLQIANMSLQIRQLEKEIEDARQDMMYRQENKSIIIDNHLKQVTEE